MRLILRYISRYKTAILLAIFIKFLSTIFELLLPYILEHMIDHVVPSGELRQVMLWGGFMFLSTLLCWGANVLANTLAINNSHTISYEVRRALFTKTAHLSGKQLDVFGLPSLISRMTSDSYNVQSGVQQIQSLCVRAPMMLLGGLLMMLMMDWHLAMVLVCALPFLLLIIFCISAKGLPLYNQVQQRLDVVVCVMRENITGVRVVKALSKTEHEKKRFAGVNEEITNSDIRAGAIMAMPSALMQICLNVGLVAVIVLGAHRVDINVIRPGVILAFLTYFNMITMGVMALNRMFMNLSKASASANRIDAVLQLQTDQNILSSRETAQPAGDELVRFEHVCFSYDAASEETVGFAGEKQEKALDDISFALKRGESLGIIGPTGCGKTTIVNLLMRFYDAESGGVYVDGRDVRTYEQDALRRKFGTVFQNDMVFQQTLRDNITFGRDLSESAVQSAAEDAQAIDFIGSLDAGLDYKASIHGANLSGGQKQRLLVARALAGTPEILILDDSSSALDYKTDAAMRRAIAERHKNSTLIMIAQRISSVMGMTHILVMDNGRCIGYGSHQELMATCAAYREIYNVQMGAVH